MERCVNKKDGFALLLTILIISLIAVFTLQLNIAMRSDLMSAASVADGIKLNYIAKSGFNYAIALLYEDALDNDFDTLHDAWSDPKALTSPTPMFEEGNFEIQIRDLSGMIAINRLIDENGGYNIKQKDLLTRFLSSPEFGLDAETVGNLVDTIKDWLDPDDEVTRFGAENSYYQGLERPYSCRNAALESLEELLYVRGISRELFFGNKGMPGISAFLTLYGDGKININTAHPIILKALSDQMDEEMVEAIVAYRSDEEHDLQDPGWYKKVPGMGEITLDPDLVTTSSAYFEISSEGVKENLRRGIKGVVKREKGIVKLLSWRTG